MNVFDLLRPSWKKAADAAAARRDAGIPAPWRLAPGPLPRDSTTLLACERILAPEERALVALSATELASQIRRRERTSEEVTRAFCKVAAIALQATNCLVELFADEALERARALDAHLERTGAVVGPLHGVPVSIKDHIDVAGHDSPCGFLALVGKMVAKEDAYLVRVLREAGAVFYCKTMNPQGIMQLETQNYLGTTVCPHNRCLTAGGSSGGEGALLGMHGSTLGVGTDIGGSVRSPAAAGGVFAFKPSVGRVPYVGCQEPADPEGCETILGTHGPMARHEQDLGLYMRIMVGSRPWEVDPSCHFRPWRTLQPPTRPLRIGVLRDDGVVRPVAPIRRALDAIELACKTRKDQFEVVEFTPFRSGDAWDLLSQLYFAADGGAGVYAQCRAAGEPVLPLTRWIIDEARLGGKAAPTAELLRLTAARDHFREAFAAHWRAAGIDFVLSPVGPTPAPPHGTAKYWNYTSFWNLVDYPAAVLPTGLSVQLCDTDAQLPDGGSGGGGWRNDKEREVWQSYDPEVSIGAPLCLQLIGYIGHDEEVLDALGRVMGAVRAVPEQLIL